MTATQPAPVSEIQKELCASLQRLHQHTLDYGESIRPDYDQQPKTLACPRHPKILRSSDWEKTLYESWRYRELRMVYAACPQCREEDDESARRRFWARRGVPDRVLEATLENFDPDSNAKTDSLQAVRQFAAAAIAPINPEKDTSRLRGGFLLLLGGTGLGKGHLAVGAMKRVGDGLFITHADLLTELRASYRTGDTAAFLERYKTARCLVLDEFGLSSGGKDEGTVLYQILAARHDQRMVTIITSNEELPTVKEVLGFRLVDRIREDFQLIILRGQSYRIKARGGK